MQEKLLIQATMVADSEKGETWTYHISNPVRDAAELTQLMKEVTLQLWQTIQRNKDTAPRRFALYLEQSRWDGKASFPNAFSLYLDAGHPVLREVVTHDILFPCGDANSSQEVDS